MTSSGEYINWIVNQFQIAPVVIPFMMATFIVNCFFFYLFLFRKHTELIGTKINQLADISIMAGFGGTLSSIFVISLKNNAGSMDIMNALSGALFSSVYGIVVALMISVFTMKLDS